MVRNAIVTIIAGALGLCHFKAEGPACHTTLYWFRTSSYNKVCGQITAGDLYPLTEVPYTTANLNPFGCEDENSYACGLGYSGNQLETIIIGGTPYLKPKNTEIANYRCCITGRNLSMKTFK